MGEMGFSLDSKFKPTPPNFNPNIVLLKYNNKPLSFDKDKKSNANHKQKTATVNFFSEQSVRLLKKPGVFR